MTPYINIHSHREALPGVLTVRSHRLGIGEETPPAPFSAGIHPWDAGRIERNAVLAELSETDMVALGEIGLDYAVEVSRDVQKDLFRSQLEIAAARRLPVILHCVKALEDVIKICTEYEVPACILHGYIGSPQQTAAALEKGFYFSFGERSLRSPKTVESLRSIPPDRLFFETDESDTPIAAIYATAADILKIELPEMQETVVRNYKTVFLIK